MPGAAALIYFYDLLLISPSHATLLWCLDLPSGGLLWDSSVSKLHSPQNDWHSRIIPTTPWTQNSSLWVIDAGATSLIKATTQCCKSLLDNWDDSDLNTIVFRHVFTQSTLGKKKTPCPDLVVKSPQIVFVRSNAALSLRSHCRARYRSVSCNVKLHCTRGKILWQLCQALL